MRYLLVYSEYSGHSPALRPRTARSCASSPAYCAWVRGYTDVNTSVRFSGTDDPKNVVRAKKSVANVN